MFEAKRLLMTTSHTVAEVSCMVGYSSVSTFTTRFTHAVGASPTKYRDTPQEFLLGISADLRYLPCQGTMAEYADQCALRSRTRYPNGSCRLGSVSGQVQLPPGAVVDSIFAGVFHTRIPQRGPVACQLLLPPVRHYRFDHVTPGTWVVLGLAARRHGDGAELGQNGAVLVGASAPIEVGSGRTTHVNLSMRRPSLIDPPLLLSLAQPQSPVSDSASRT
jgi:hypothetical protein